MIAKSKSRKVNSYVKLALKLVILEEKYKERLARIEPLQRKIQALRHDLVLRIPKMTGGQIAEAKRILATRQQGGINGNPSQG